MVFKIDKAIFNLVTTVLLEEFTKEYYKKRVFPSFPITFQALFSTKIGLHFFAKFLVNQVLVNDFI